MWLSARRITSLRERCCDLIAIEAGGLSAQSYAKSLLRVAELQRNTVFDSDAAAGLSSSVLTERVRDTLTPRNQRFTILPLLIVVAALSSMSLIFTPIDASANTFRGSEANSLLTQLGAVSPMPRIKNLGNFIGGANETCSLPQRSHYHPGVDFFPGINDPHGVNAIADGKVVGVIKASADFEMMVQISHADDVISTYVHLGDVTVKPGDRVRAGQRIGTLGNNHLHLEVRKGVRLIDPSALPDKSPTIAAAAAVIQEGN
jgi:hypothetical protein